MGTFVTLLRLMIRITFPVLMVLGILFWRGQMLQLLRLHMALGGLFALVVGVMGILAVVRGASRGMGIFLIPLGIAVMVVGVGQVTMLPGPNHWIIRVVHVVIDVVAVVFAERVGAKLKAGVARVSIKDRAAAQSQ